MTLTTLKRIIQNPFYYGAFIWKKKLYLNANHKPIISKALWDKANAALNDINRSYNKDEVDYHFSGLLKCSQCERSISGAYTIKNPDKPEKMKKHRYYRCRHQKTHMIKGYWTERDLADKILLSVVKAVYIPKETTDDLQKAIERISGKQTFIKQNKRDILQAEYEDSLKQMDNLYKLQIRGNVKNVEMFEKNENELNETIVRLKNELALCNTDEKETVQKAKALFYFINELERVYTESNDEDKSLIIKEICGISMIKGREVIPNYQEPFDTVSRINQAIKDKNLYLKNLTPKNLLENPTVFDGSTENTERLRRELNTQPTA